MTTSIKKKYDKLIPELKKQLKEENPMALPRLVKVSVSVGIGSMITSGTKDYSHIENNIMSITGQKPLLKKARKAISNFKLRAGLPVGLTVTLRGVRMFDFLERLINVALPRVRDFQGLSARGFDNNGNYCLGLKEVSIFPEVRSEDMTKTHGLQVNITTTAKTKEDAFALLKSLGLPLRNELK